MGIDIRDLKISATACRASSRRNINAVCDELDIEGATAAL